MLPTFTIQYIPSTLTYFIQSFVSHLIIPMVSNFLLLFPILVLFISSFSQSTSATFLWFSTKTSSPDSGKCDLNLCFGLEGTQAIQGKNFQIQKQLVSALVKKLSPLPHLQLAAVQYGFSNTAISPLTSDIDSFLEALSESSFDASDETAIGSPIVYCDSQLSEEEGRNIIILLGRGRNTFGGDPMIRSELFRKQGGHIVTIGIGKENKKNLQKITGGFARNVIDFNSDVDDTVKRVVGILCPNTKL